MIIRSMQANFGKLQEQTLELHNGLNVLYMPNESGKSTWSEFLLAMLYGIDTREQRRKGHLPVKEKYRPWAGGGMHGAMVVDTGSRTLRLERTGTERAPMSQLRVFDPDSGQQVSLPEGESCGRALIGAERSVYERSGFLRQQQLALTQDPALEQRLAALVTTGDEAYSYTKLEKQLRELKNRCRYNRSGLIPETERALHETQAQLAQVRAVQSSLAELELRRQTLATELEDWQRKQKLCDMAEASRRQQALAQARQALAEDQLQAEALAAQCALLPAQQALHALLQRIDKTETALTSAQAQLAAVPPGDQPSALSAQRPRIAVLCKPQPAVKKLPLVLALILLLLGPGLSAAGILLPLLPLMIGGATAAAAGLVFLLIYLHAIRQSKRLRARRQSGESEAAHQQQFAQATQAVASCSAEKDALLREVDAFGRSVTNLHDARDVVTAAIRQHEAQENAAARAAASQTHLEQLLAVTGGKTAQTEALPEGIMPPDPYEVQSGLARCTRALRQVCSERDRAAGQLSAYEDALVLEARCAKLRERLSELEQKNAGLTLALEALTEANSALQARFAPLVCERASELFSLLTQGRYERVTLDEELNVTVLERGASVSRPLQYLSAGTVDQLYLALRLAISELLLKDAPLVLDDALVTFDDERAKIALQVLKKEAQRRQILLFTCQRREQRLLK